MGIKVCCRFVSRTYLNFLVDSIAECQADRLCVKVQGLSKLLADHAAGCCREQKYDNYFGRKIAIDASMHIYQALVEQLKASFTALLLQRCSSCAVQVVVGRTGDQTLTNEAGEVTRSGRFWPLVSSHSLRRATYSV